jgi:surface protein
MSCMFDGCSSLSSLPDISKWNTSNVTDMSYMFSGCNKSLKIPKFKQ